MNRFPNNISTTSCATSSLIKNNGDKIIVAIVTNNLSQVKILIDRLNVNSIIDSKNNYTALHYAVTLPNNDITEYILNLGANPKIKQNSGYDAFELSSSLGRTFICKYFRDKHSVIVDRLQDENKILTQSNRYQEISIDKYNDKINSLNGELELQVYNNIKLENTNKASTVLCGSLRTNIITISNSLTSLKESHKTLTNENNRLKRSCDDLDKAFTALLKKQKK
jgi:ankyrin repeat protein